MVLVVFRDPKIISRAGVNCRAAPGKASGPAKDNRQSIFVLNFILRVEEEKMG